MRVELISNGIDETIHAGISLGEKLNPRDVVALIGELGSGKTSFIKGIAKGLGIREEVKSPTYTLINEYKGRFPFYHFDLYRISSIHELEELGYREYLYGDGITVIEWADKFPEIVPAGAFRVEIVNLGANRRRILIEGEENVLKLIG